VIAFLSGLLAGSLHVVSGPDHVAAVAPLAVRTPGAGRSLGALWGVGHGGGVLVWLLGAAAFQHLFGHELPSAALEGLVGVALIGLGAVNWRRARSVPRPHVHVHAHGWVDGHIAVPDGRSHVHLHVHEELPHGHAHGSGHDRSWATAVAMGLLHGSAGASHLLALLPTLGLAGNGALFYVCGYLLAGVLAMASVSSLLAGLATLMPEPSRLQRFCALGVLAVGSYWLLTAVRELA
jgi:hypothetical protein